MKVSQALETRMSVRAFTDEPIPVETIKRVLEKSARAPSGSNLQPWRIVILTPEKLADLNALMKKRLAGEENPKGDTQEYQIHPDKLKEPYRTSRYEVGEDMYSLLGLIVLKKALYFLVRKEMDYQMKYFNKQMDL